MEYHLSQNEKNYIEVEEEVEEFDINDLEEINEINEIINLNINDFNNIKDDCCLHKITIKDGNIEKCKDCGLELCNELSMEPEWRCYDGNNKGGNVQLRCHLRKNDSKNIYKDLEEYKLPKDIQLQTNSLYLEVTAGGILRANNRKAIIYACVMYSYKNSNIIVPDEIKNSFKLTKKEIAKGVKTFKLSVDKTRKTTYSSKEIYIDKIMKHFNANEKHIERVKDLYNKIKDKNKILFKSHQQSVMSSLIYCYWKMLASTNSDYDISCEKFSKIVKLSMVTINRLSKIIIELFGIKDKINL